MIVSSCRAFHENKIIYVQSNSMQSKKETLIFPNFKIHTQTKLSSSTVNKLVDEGDDLKIFAKGITANIIAYASPGSNEIIEIANTANAKNASILLVAILAAISPNAITEVKYTFGFCFTTFNIIYLRLVFVFNFKHRHKQITNNY